MSAQLQVVETIPTDVQEKATAAESALGQARALSVTDETTYEEGGAFIRAMKDHKKKLNDERMELTRPLDKAKKTLMDWFNPHITNLDKAIKELDQKMVGYYREQERKRLKAEAEAAEKARKERERLEKRAAKAEEKGQEEKAEALRQEQEFVQHEPTAPAPVKQTANSTMRTTYAAQVADKLTLLEAVVDGTLSMELITVNMTALNAIARSQKDTFKVPGCRLVKDTTTVSKR